MSRQACKTDGPFCTARADPKLRPGATITCFHCGEAVCLSCSVPMTVPAPAGRTYGRQHVCHGCACGFPGGQEIVIRQLSRFGGKNATVSVRVPEPAPAIRAMNEKARIEVAAKMRKAAIKNKRRAHEEAQRRLPGVDAPARAKPLPKALATELFIHARR
jgi:hypothetical protein